MRGFLIIPILLAFIQIAFSQSYIPSIVQYTTKDGLSSNEVYAIHKDARGFMWIGTQYGLNRFDGREFAIYTRETFPDLDFNIINDIMEDEEGNLWLVKSQEKYQHTFSSVEVNLFNIYTGKINTLEEHFGEDLPFVVADISFLEQLKDGSIFIYCEQKRKVFTFSSETGFQTIPFPEDFIGIRTVLLTDDGQFIICGSRKNQKPQIFKINQEGEIVNNRFPGMEWKIYDKDEIYFFVLK